MNKWTILAISSSVLTLLTINAALQVLTGVIPEGVLTYNNFYLTFFILSPLALGSISLYLWVKTLAGSNKKDYYKK